MDSIMTIMGHFDISTKDHVQFAILFSLVVFTRCSVPAGPIININDTVHYFERYGHIPSLHNGQLQDIDVLTSALARFQDLCRLNRTGNIIDEATADCFNRPRCGNPDFPTESHGRPGGRKRRYYIPPEGASWSAPSTHMTYDIVMYSDDLPPTVIDDSIARAFEIWSNATVLSFSRIRGGDVDISIYFYPSFEEHGDNMPFDGPGLVLAHAFWPWSDKDRSDVHFDEAETWTSGSYSGANLWLVAAHEIGHSLGLGHSIIFGTLMFPFHFGYNPNFILHEDDISGIRALYGETVRRPNEGSPDAPDICQVVMDAVMVDGFTYIFKGESFWKVLNGQPEPGYPQRISDRWPGLEGDLDAALTVKNDYVWKPHTGKTYFFKGRRVWRYTLNSLDAGFPRDAAEEFLGFPSDIHWIKGIFEISGNGETYIFTDNGFYVYNWLGFQGPYGLQAFGGVPNNIIGAVQWTDNYIYFFTDDFLYYQCSPWSFTISRGYPRFAHVDWLGCPNNLQGSSLRLPAEDSSLLGLEGHNLTETGSDRSSAYAAVAWTFTTVLFGLGLSALV